MLYEDGHECYECWEFSFHDADVFVPSHEDVVAVVGGAENPVSPVVKPSFSAVVSEKNVSNVAVLVQDENALPNHPLTAFFTPQVRFPAADVFRAFRESNVNSSDVSCLQRTSNGQVVVTFRRAECKEQFLRKSVLNVSGMYALQDVDRPLTYLQIFDAPHELPDPAIIQRLSRYCDVIHHRRGFFTEPGWEHVHNGVRHYRVRIKSPIPSFLRFDRYYVQFRYVGQPRTCRLCGQTNHLASACHTIICFNCEKTGHLASDCPCPTFCNICKSPTHCARSCPLSWSRVVDVPASTSESSPMNFENTDTTENTQTENSEITGPTENTDTPASDNSENSISDKTTSDLLVDLPPPNLTPASDAVDLDNSEQDYMDQDSSDSTLLDETYSSATEEQTMDLFSDTPPSRPSANGRKPTKISQAFIPHWKPTAPKLVTGKPSREYSPDSDDSPTAKKPNTGRTNKHKHGKKKN